jgi:lipid II:glycine glycyltransferase (peptidoglycan interpeptide bridge formation enzyme)
LRRKGFEVVEATTIDEIDKFVSIYHETMQRVNANSNYFFDYKYFYSFLKNPCFKSKLLLAKFNGEVSAGAIFTITNKIMQYHLAGTTEKYIKETPMKLILDEARLLANQLNLDYLHLGGGVGGSDEDSLFRFKSGFSDKRGFYNIWKMVVDDEKYEKLVNELNVDTNSDFFPLYRV